MGCPMATGDPKARTCLLCAEPLTGLRQKWCRDECADTYWANHAWGVARPAVLYRDRWTCVRCGIVGWADVPRHVLAIEGRDHRLDPPAPSLEDWAVALRLLQPVDLQPLRDWQADSRRHEAVQAVVAGLPESIRVLVRSEQAHRGPRYWAQQGNHELEVNHIVPRKGRGYGNGCHHHQDNLETLCRPCHVDETRRQRLGLPSWRHDDRSVEILLGRGVQGVLV